MIISLNGERREVTSPNLHALMTELELEPETVATALNREFVPRAERQTTPIADGDAVEILSPMKGG